VVGDGFTLSGGGNRGNMSGGSAADIGLTNAATFSMSGGNVAGDVFGFSAGTVFSMSNGTGGGEWLFEAGAVFEMSGGSINGDVELFNGGILNFSGGDITSSNILRYDDSTVNLTGGDLNAFTRFIRSDVVITAGTLTAQAMFEDTTIDMSGGRINGPFSNVDDGSTLNMSGGTLGSLALGVSDGGTLNLSGGTVEDGLQAGAGSEVNLFGTEFFLDGAEITGLIPNQPFVITTRGGAELTGLLADGSAFDFDLLTTNGANDRFDPNATLTVTLIPEPGSAALLAIALPLLARRRRRY